MIFVYFLLNFYKNTLFHKKYYILFVVQSQQINALRDKVTRN